MNEEHKHARYSGNSVIIGIDQELLKTLEWKENDELKFVLMGNGICVSPALGEKYEITRKLRNMGSGLILSVPKDVFFFMQWTPVYKDHQPTNLKLQFLGNKTLLIIRE
jgi:antitoxin component of MazEF toxin-antitoxin module